MTAQIDVMVSPDEIQVIQTLEIGPPGAPGSGGGSGAVDSVNGRTGAVVGLAEQTAVTAEATARAAADTAEASARGAADAAEAVARAAADALLVPLTQRGTANGVATLDGGSKIPAAQLPSIAISDFLGSVASQAAMLALVGQRGDWCNRTDLSQSLLLVADDASVLANWQVLLTPADMVSSVNGRTGAVTGLAEQTAVDAEAATRAAADTAEATARTAGDTGHQPANANLTTIAGLDPLTAGVLATDGAGWIRKSFGAIKTALGLGTSATRDVGTTAGTVAAGDDARLASEAAAWTAADTAVKAAAMGACIYTAGAYPARPTGYAAVMFVGPTAPSEQTGADIWIAWTPPVPFSGARATETDSAFAGLLYATALGGSKATETDSAFAGGFVSLFSIGGTQAIETDTAFAGVLYQTIAVGAKGTETDTAFAGAFVSGGSPITNAALAAITNAALAPITTA